MVIHFDSKTNHGRVHSEDRLLWFFWLKNVHMNHFRPSNLDHWNILGLTILTAVYARRPPFLQELEIQEFGGKVDVTEAADFLKQGGLNGPKGRDESDEKLRKLDFSNFDKESTQGESNSFNVQNDKKRH